MDRADDQTDLVRLAARAREGDGVALERVLAEVHVHVHGFFRQWLHRRRERVDVVDDLTQETLIKFATGMPACEAATDGALLEWCRRIAVNVGTDYLRKMRDEWAATVFTEHLELAGALDWDVPEHDIAGDAGTAIMLRVLREAHEAEGQESQLLLWERVVEGDGWAEAGGTFGIAPTAAKRRFQRAQTRLRNAVLRRLIRLPPEELAAVRRWMLRVDVQLRELTS